MVITSKSGRNSHPPWKKGYHFGFFSPFPVPREEKSIFLKEIFFWLFLLERGVRAWNTYFWLKKMVGSFFSRWRKKTWTRRRELPLKWKKDLLIICISQNWFCCTKVTNRFNRIFQNNYPWIYLFQYMAWWHLILVHYLTASSESYRGHATRGPTVMGHILEVFKKDFF